jgi:hypothetical protein
METSDQQRSILLVDIMNAIGFSKIEREIHRYGTHLWNVLVHIFRPTDKGTVSITGSSADGTFYIDTLKQINIKLS